MGDDLQTPWERARKARHVTQEERLGQTPGGRQGVASGRLWRFPRDGTLWGFLVEARTTEKGSYTISKSEFEALTRQAYAMTPPMLPCMEIQIGELDLVTIRRTDFIDWQTRLAELEEKIEEWRESVRDE